MSSQQLKTVVTSTLHKNTEEKCRLFEHQVARVSFWVTGPSTTESFRELNFQGQRRHGFGIAIGTALTNSQDFFFPNILQNRMLNRGVKFSFSY